jgi:hypothetical protein
MASRHAAKQAHLLFKLAAASGAYSCTFHVRCDSDINIGSCVKDPSDPQPQRIEEAAPPKLVSLASATPVQAAEPVQAEVQIDANKVDEDAAAQKSRWSVAQARRGTLAFVEKIHDFNMPAAVEEFCRTQAAAALAIGQPLSLTFYNAVLAKLSVSGAWQSSAALLDFMRVCTQCYELLHAAYSGRHHNAPR